MSTPWNPVSEDSSLLHPSVAVTLPKLNVMSKKLLQKGRQKVQEEKKAIDIFQS